MSFGKLLLWRWDPIGVADYFPDTADEYDGYAPQVVHVLRAGGDADAITAHLVELSASRWTALSRHRSGSPTSAR
jgi:hypothetical protein